MWLIKRCGGVVWGAEAFLFSPPPATRGLVFSGEGGNALIQIRGRFNGAPRGGQQVWGATEQKK